MTSFPPSRSGCSAVSPAWSSPISRWRDRGVVRGALASACISLVKILADPYDQLPAITFWLLGSLAGVKLADLAVARSGSREGRPRERLHLARENPRRSL